MTKDGALNIDVVDRAEEKRILKAKEAEKLQADGIKKKLAAKADKAEGKEVPAEPEH